MTYEMRTVYKCFDANLAGSEADDLEIFKELLTLLFRDYPLFLAGINNCLLNIMEHLRKN